MALTGKCPKCERIVTHLELQNPKVRDSARNEFFGVSYLCPLCKTILGAGIDPVALKTDTVNEVLKTLKGR